LSKGDFEMIKELLPEAVLYFDPNRRTRKSYKAKDFRYLIRSVEERRLVQIIHNKEELYDFQDLLDKTLQLFVDNIIRRVQAILIAKSRADFKTLGCTEDGSLWVSWGRTALDAVGVFEGDAPDDYTTLEFTNIPDIVDIWIYDNTALLKFQTEAATSFANLELEMWASCFYSIPARIKKIQIKNKTAGSVARYKILGWRKS